ncbi:hypothetical protein [Lysobacter gummosus]|uniref:hypothetical protein n=1 Tax=Lysobacter gummosus TaxID=262324 RepID=UPI00363B4AF2
MRPGESRLQPSRRHGSRRLQDSRRARDCHTRLPPSNGCPRPAGILSPCTRDHPCPTIVPYA